MRLSSYDLTTLALAWLGLPAAQAASMTRSHRSAGQRKDHFVTLGYNGQCVGAGVNAAGRLNATLATCHSTQANQHWRLHGQKLQHIVLGCLGAQTSVAGAAIGLVACNGPQALNFTRNSLGALTTSQGLLCLDVAGVDLSLQPCASAASALTVSTVTHQAQSRTTLLPPQATSPMTTRTQTLTQVPGFDVVVTVTQTVYESETVTVGAFSTVTVTNGGSMQDAMTTPLATAAEPASMSPPLAATPTLAGTPTATASSIADTPVPSTSTTPTTTSSLAAITPAQTTSLSVYNPTCSNLGAWPLSSATFEAEVLRLINLQRGLQTTCGTTVYAAVPPLVVDDAITCVSRAFALDMFTYNYFSHTDRSGNSPFTRLSNAGVRWQAAAENIAEGQTTPSQVVSAWVNSPGHCADLMGDYTRTGVGFVNNYWVQDFISP